MLCINVAAQTGKYVGFLKPYTPEKLSKKEEEEIGQKILVLNKDSTFHFQYNFVYPFAQQFMQLKECSGTWEISNDTITLNSKYQSSDFINATEKYIPTSESKLIKINIGTRGGDFKLTISVNDKQIGTYFPFDTIYYRCAFPEKIRIEFDSPEFPDYVYEVINPKANNFSFDITTLVNDNTLYFKDCKLKIKNNLMYPVTRYGPLNINIDKPYKKAKQ